ncbi:hypothetical protein EU537_07495 [Candidatus Thorarchaeota archaeon]|nr:MAG: hypothetical protein EU537_07495 [Candidatus Thorarchaeota archaeon]
MGPATTKVDGSVNMKKYQRILGIAMTVLSIISLYVMETYLSPAIPTQPFIILFNFLLTLFLPGLFIDFVFSRLGTAEEGDISEICGGLQYGGYLIGYTERSLIYVAFMIAYFDSAISLVSVLSFLSVIVASKAIFRYSSRGTDDRACADWYILGTLMSITLALALTWFGFRFLLTG